ncbi:iron ABC transporter permease [Burkholderia sp. ABCPW 14]|uniref:Iron ABC transporter permease n=1 Tax=Burkholderia mayonis TaxID=1385591 RepID=A0A1B4G395_9BURK|nr:MULTISPECIES: iron ABC transporter permease [Burkholderia]AOJ10375.1 iron ABC transporter permease [Burkholderia mayonis]KVD80859.1 iron ABC transporter permease [Burkholderia sp. ABCPW 14]KVE53645.1 iron ABC transporter permease [Burkholderia mayonis]
MFPILSPEAIEALKWIDQFGAGRPLPTGFRLPLEELLNDGLVYLSGPDRVDITDDGKAYLSEAYD